MANVITAGLSKLSGKNITNIDLLNSIREMASPEYQADIPVLAGPINHATMPYEEFAVHQNEFFEKLINRIGVTVIKGLMFENPLAIFKSEIFEYGDVLQEIFVTPAVAEKYNAKGNDHPFSFYDTDIKVLYHDLNNENVYSRSVNEAWVKKAFTSEYAFDEFVDKLIKTLISSDELDEYMAVKAVLENALNEVDFEGHKIAISATKVDTSQPDYMVDFNTNLIKLSKQFAIPSKSSAYNPVGVTNVTPVEDQYLIIDADFSSQLDLLYANAFNMDKASVQARQIIVDDFAKFTGAGQHNGRKPVAFLVSKKSIILKDKMVKMTTAYNPKTLNINYFLHHHYLTSLSLFENIHVFYTE